MIKHEGQTSRLEESSDFYLGNSFLRLTFHKRFMLLAIGLIVFGLSFTAPSCFAGNDTVKGLPDVPKAFIPKASVKPVIDGKVDAKEWDDALKLELRINSGEKVGGLPLNPTTVRLKWDENNLYVSFVCNDKDIKKLVKGRVAPQDLWGKEPEIAELILCPDGNVNEYFEFCFNPGGALADIKLTWDNPKADFPKVNKWNAVNIVWAVDIKGTSDASEDVDEYWSLEIAIGWNSFPGIKPKAGMEMRANLYRADNSETLAPRGHSAWSPTGKHFQVPARFGHMTLTK